MNKVELIKAVAEATNNTQKDIKVITPFFTFKE